MAGDGMLRYKGIRFKLAAVLVAPTLALVTLAGLGYTDRRAAVESADTITRLAGLAGRIGPVVHELQIERDLAVAPLSSAGGGSSTMASNVDAAVSAFEAEASASKDLAVGAEFGANVDRALAGLARLPEIRALAGTDIRAAFAGYTEVIADLLAVDGRIPAETTEPELAAHVTAYVALAEGKEYAAQEHSLVDSFWNISALTGDELQRLVAIVALQDEAYSRFEAAATDTERAWLTEVFESADGRKVVELRSQLLSISSAGELAVDPSIWTYYASRRHEALKVVQDRLDQEIIELSAALRDKADRESLLFAAGAAIAVLLALLIATAVVRAILSPLRRLTDAAHSIARVQLPGLVERLKSPGGDTGTVHIENVQVESDDEIGQLAEAFNAIQAVAVEVAREQAVVLRKGISDLYVNLARRNQSLLDRQISFLDELEASERDPDTLENLFTLDHLATRMRRNAESLLVLAGVEPNRRWERAVALSDVIRGAIGEIEDFSRIDLVAFDDATIVGRAAVDAAHLLAELIENAAHFSPPESRVEVSGLLGGHAYLITVVDHGIGMSEAHLLENNSLLIKPPVMGLALSRTLGMIVVARLASRFGITVRLLPTPGGGITVHVTLPLGLLSDATATAGLMQVSAGSGGLRNGVSGSFGDVMPSRLQGRTRTNTTGRPAGSSGERSGASVSAPSDPVSPDGPTAGTHRRTGGVPVAPEALATPAPGSKAPGAKAPGSKAPGSKAPGSGRGAAPVPAAPVPATPGTSAPGSSSRPDVPRTPIARPAAPTPTAVPSPDKLRQVIEALSGSSSPKAAPTAEPAALRRAPNPDDALPRRRGSGETPPAETPSSPEVGTATPPISGRARGSGLRPASPLPARPADPAHPPAPPSVEALPQRRATSGITAVTDATSAPGPAPAQRPASTTARSRGSGQPQAQGAELSESARVDALPQRRAPSSGPSSGPGATAATAATDGASGPRSAGAAAAGRPRTPEEVRLMLSSYRSGRKKGQAAAVAATGTNASDVIVSQDEPR